MKAVNKASQILAIVLAAAALVLFFFEFVTVPNQQTEPVSLIGAELAFGTDIEGVGELYKSSKILFCFILTVLTVLFSSLTFKFKKMRYAAPTVGLVGAIFMLVIALSRSTMYFDHRPLIIHGLGAPEYTIFVLLIPIALFASVAAGVTHLIVDDRIMVAQGKRKATIFSRLVHTLRDYKSELKKITWPGLRDVIKNTLVVFAVCLVIGAFIWLVDFGLGELIKLITTKA